MNNTFWFYHDFDPMGDAKMQAFVGDFGGLGYGIFWRIVEMLHKENTHKLPLKNYLFKAIAKQMEANAKQNIANAIFPEIHLTAEQINHLISSCINDYELFNSDGSFFWSERVFRNYSKRNEISEKRAKAGKLGGLQKGKNQHVVANAKQKIAKPSEERRGEENKDTKELKSLQYSIIPKELLLCNAGQRKNLEEFVTSYFAGITPLPQFFKPVDEAKKYCDKVFSESKTKKINDREALLKSWIPNFGNIKNLINEKNDKRGNNDSQYAGGNDFVIEPSGKFLLPPKTN